MKFVFRIIIFYHRHTKVNIDLFNSCRNWLLKYILRCLSKCGSYFRPRSQNPLTIKSLKVLCSPVLCDILMTAPFEISKASPACSCDKNTAILRNISLWAIGGVILSG